MVHADGFQQKTSTNPRSRRCKCRLLSMQKSLGSNKDIGKRRMRLNLKLELTDQISRGRISVSALPIPFNQRCPMAVAFSIRDCALPMARQ